MTDDDGSDDTPREQRVTDSQRVVHYSEYPPGTLAVREFVPTPHNMYEVQLGDRLKVLEAEVASLSSSRKFWRWIAGLGLPSLAAILLYTAEKVTSGAEHTGKSDATMDIMQSRINLMESYIHELQRHAGMTSPPVTSGRVGFNP